MDNLFIFSFNIKNEFQCKIKNIWTETWLAILKDRFFLRIEFWEEEKSLKLKYVFAFKNVVMIHTCELDSWIEESLRLEEESPCSCGV